MSAPSMQKFARLVVFIGLAAVTMLLSGCLEQLLVWSPDGQRAVAIDAQAGGLRLCDASGKLSAPMLPGAYRVAWLPDSRQLVVMTVREEANWAAVAKELTAQMSARVIERVEMARQKLLAGAPWSEVRVGLSEGGTPEAIFLACLRERHGEAVRAKLTPEERESFDSAKAEIFELALARIEGDSLVKGKVLDHGLTDWISLRMSPDGSFLAAVRQTLFSPADTFELLVTPLRGGASIKIAESVAKWPDWTPDGRALVYAQAGNSISDVTLGSLVQKEVLDASGQLTNNGKAKQMAGWIFNDNTRVRCLRDGRILFNAVEITLPIAVSDFGDQHEQLFAVDPNRQATLVRLIPRSTENAMPRSLAFFDVSPDERKVLFGSSEGEVMLLSIADGDVRQIQEGGKLKVLGAPQWRTATEFSFMRAAPSKDGVTPARRGEVILHDGDRPRVLSEEWPEALLNGWFASDR